MEQKKDHILDLRGIIAPVTLLKVTQAFGGLNSGEILEVLGKDSDTRMQIFQVLNTFNYRLLNIKDESSYYRIRLMKASANNNNNGFEGRSLK